MPEHVDDREDHERRWQWGVEARPMEPVELPGDERERTVLLEAALRGNRAMLTAMLSLALVTAVLGSWLIPAAILVSMIVAGRVMRDYASERGVDSDRLTEQRPTRSVRYLLGNAGIVFTLAAMSYTGATGDGLLPVPHIDGAGPDASALLGAAATGLPAGAAVVFVVLAALDAVRRRRPTASRN